MNSLNLCLGLAFSAMAIACRAGFDPPEKGEGANREEEAAQEIQAEWRSDYPGSLDVAEKQHRRVLLNFTGSDWSPPSSRWWQQVLSTPQFAEYADRNLVLVEIDFPRNREQPPELVRQNNELQARFEVEEFPTLILLDFEGNEIRRMSGVLPEGPRQFILWLRRTG